MTNLPDPKLWTPFDTLPYVVWIKIFEKLNVESMRSLRKLTSDLDCCVPAHYNPTLELNEVFRLLSPNLTYDELFSFRKVNSIWRQSINTLLNSKWSDWREEITLRSSTPYIGFSTAADFQKFDDTFGMLPVDPILHRRVIFRIPEGRLDIEEFIAAARHYLNKHGKEIWHLGIETHGSDENNLPLANMIISFVFECLASAWNMKTLYLSTMFMMMIWLNGYEVETYSDLPPVVPWMARLQKLTVNPFEPKLWRNLVRHMESSLKAVEIYSYNQWADDTCFLGLTFSEVDHFKVVVLPETIHNLVAVARQTNWRLSTFHIVFRMGSLKSVALIRKTIRRYQDTLEELSIKLWKIHGKSVPLKGVLSRLQRKLQLPNLKRLKLTNFNENSFELLPEFAPKLETFTLTNCVSR